MDASVVSMVVMVGCLALWGFTGRDPLWWLIHALIFVRAAIVLAWRIRGEACDQFRDGLAGEVRDMRIRLMAEDL